MTINQETQIQRAILLALSEAGCVVFRNNTAGAWIGRKVHQAGNQITLADAHMIKFGLCVGSSDLCGIAPVVVTSEMVGMTIGVFTAIEVKTPTGRATQEQLHFIERVRASGGIAGIARTPAEALALLTKS